jgi:reactive intermediate/imine deaminase
MLRGMLVVLMTLSAFAAERRVITPANGAPPVGPYSPGLLAGDYLYVSGQGPALPGGGFPTGVEEQTAQTLRNVDAIVKAAGLTMEHIVYAHVYLKDIARVDEMERAWKGVFPKNPPARVVLGVEKMPVETPVEITVVAVRDLASKRVVPGGVLTHDRMYLSGCASVEEMEKALKGAGLDLRHLAFVNPYLTAKMPMARMNEEYAKHFEFGNTPARATIQVAALPGGAPAVFTGVAARDLPQRRAVRPKNMPPSATASPCVWIGETLFCSAKSGFIPGPNSGIYASTVETQVRQTMRNLLDGLEEGGLTFENVVATNVYLDDIGEFAKMNKTYAEYFGKTPPTRTTIQPFPSVERKPSANDRWPALEQISLIAVK